MPVLLTPVAVALLAVAAPERPTIAVLPPVPIDGAESWVGMALADNVAADLLRYARTTKAGAKEYPLNVMSWRETLSAARAEGLSTTTPLSPGSEARLAAQLGARWVFAGSYKIKGGKVLLKWHLTDTRSKKPARETRVTTNLATVSKGNDALVTAVLKGLGEKKVQRLAPLGKKPPTDAMESYGRGLMILAKQSLEPYAPVVLPALELKKARLLFEEATKQAPTLWRAWIGLSMSSAMLGELERAEKELVTALAHVGDFEPQNALGLYYVYVRQEKPAEAIAALVEATSKHPGFMGGLGYLGSAYLRAGDIGKAVEVFRTYKERVPSSPWARLNYARALGYAGKADAALAEAAAVAMDFPDSPAVIEALAARQTQAKKLAEAIATLERGLAKHPEHPALLTRLSYVRLQQGAPDEALAIARRAVAQLGDGRGEVLAGYAYTNLGHALALTGKREEAIAAFEKAVKLGVGLEERLQLLADERTKKLVPKDAPPPPPPAAAQDPVLTAEERGEDSAEVEASEDAEEDWDEDEAWAEGEDWEEEELDDAQ